MKIAWGWVRITDLPIERLRFDPDPLGLTVAEPVRALRLVPVAIALPMLDQMPVDLNCGPSNGGPLPALPASHDSSLSFHPPHGVSGDSVSSDSQEGRAADPCGSEAVSSTDPPRWLVLLARALALGLAALHLVATGRSLRLLRRLP